MNPKIKKIFFWLPLCVLIIVAIAFSVMLAPKLFKKKATIDYVKYNDNLSDLNVADANGNDYQLEKGKYKYLFYASAECGDCIEKLPTYDKLQKIFTENNSAQFMIMWENKIPTDKVKQYELDAHSYSLNNVSIANNYSTIIVLDKENNVVFIDSTGIDNFVRYLFESVEMDNEILINNANTYLLEKYTKNVGKDKLIYFSMPGCKDCNEAKPILSDAAITDKYEIVTIELEKGSKAGDILDDHLIFQRIYEIDWYPSFLILRDSSWDIVRKLEISEIKSTILNLSST